MTERIQIGFLGGCLITGWDTVPIKSIYHQVIRRKIKNELALKSRFFLDVYGEFQDMEGFFSVHKTRQEITIKIIKLIEKGADCIILQVRPYLYMNFCQAFTLEEKSIFSINPWLVGERKIRINLGIFTEPLAGLLKRGRLKIGHSLGLQRRASNFLEDMLQEISIICQSKKVKLFILLPFFPLEISPKYREEFIDLLQNWKPNLEAFGTSFVEVQDQLHHRDFFELDRAHLNSAGHARIAELLFPELKKWLTTQNPF